MAKSEGFRASYHSGRNMCQFVWRTSDGSSPSDWCIICYRATRRSLGFLHRRWLYVAVYGGAVTISAW